MKPISLTLIFTLSFFFSFSQYQQVVYEENFDGCQMPFGWQVSSQNPSSDGWQVGDSASHSSSGFRIADNGSCFAVLNDSRPGNPATHEVLETPGFDFTRMNTPYIMFDVYGPPKGAFIVMIEQNGIARQSLFTTSMDYFFKGEWQTIKWPVAGIQGDKSNISFLFEFRDYGFDYPGIAIDNFRIVEPFSNDVEMVDLSQKTFFTQGAFPLEGTFRNHGNNTIQSVTLNWQIDQLPVSSQYITNFAVSGGLKHAFRNAFSVPAALQLNALALGKHQLKVWTSLPNGQADSYTGNDTLFREIQVVSQLPPKRVLVEKFSHNTCGPCFLANQELEQMLAVTPEAVAIGIHHSSTDPLTIPAGKTIDTTFVRAHADFTIDRFKFNHLNSMTVRFGLITDQEVNIRVANGEAAAIHIENSLFNPTTREVSLDVVATFYGEYDDQLAFNVAFIEDSILGYQTSAPDPNNYWHMKVLREMLGGAWGETGNLLAQVQAGQLFRHSFSYVLPANFKAKDVKVIAFLQRKEDDLFKRDIINTTEARPLINFANDISADESIPFHIFPNPARDYIYLETDLPVYRVSLLDVQGKEVIRPNAQVKKLDVSGLPWGMYLLRIATNEKTYCRRINIH